MGTKSEAFALAHRDEGCLGKAAPNEPIFVLRAQDLLAADTVRMWAHQLAERRGYGNAKAQEAFRLADQMEAWPNRKVPD